MTQSLKLEVGNWYENQLGGRWLVEKEFSPGLFICRTMFLAAENGNRYDYCCSRLIFLDDGENCNPNYGPLVKLSSNQTFDL